MPSFIRHMYECSIHPLSNYAVPTVSGVESKALTLDAVQVDVTVSDDGGQPVLEYTVSLAHGNGWVAYVTGECHNG